MPPQTTRERFEARARALEQEPQEAPKDTGFVAGLRRNFDPRPILESLGVKEASEAPGAEIGRQFPGAIPNFQNLATIAKGTASTAANVFNELVLNRPGESLQRGGKGFLEAVELLRSGDTAGGLERLREVIGTDLPGAVPVIGPIATDISERIRGGDVSGAAVDVLALTPGAPPGAISRTMRRGARRSGIRLLKPQGKVGAEVAREVMRDFPSRAPLVRTAEQFEFFVGDKLNNATSALDNALDSPATLPINGLPPPASATLRNNPFDLNPIIQNLEVARDAKTIGGQPMLRQGTRNLDNAIRDLRKIQDTGEVSLGQVIELRRELDKSINFNATSESGIASQTTRRLESNLLRDSINTQYPSLAQANNEFSFWADIEKFARARGNAKITQEVLANVSRFESIMQGTLIGGGITAAVAGAGAPAALASGLGVVGFGGSQILKETAGFQSFNTVAKTKIADLLGSGKFQAAMDLITATAIVNQSQDAQRRKQGPQIPKPGQSIAIPQ